MYFYTTDVRFRENNFQLSSYLPILLFALVSPDVERASVILSEN